MSADLLRQAADAMQDFGFIHAAIAEGLRAEADRLDSGEQAEIEPESLELAQTYVENLPVMTAHVYAVRYPDSLVRDSSWCCVADVIASFHGGYYTSERGQVTGTLVRAVVGTDVWVEV